MKKNKQKNFQKKEFEFDFNEEVDDKLQYP